MMIWLPFPEPKPPSGTVETMFEVGLSLIRGWWLRDRPTFLCWLWDVFCLDLKLFKKKIGISIQCSVNQYLGTVKYHFILQISILYFFIGNPDTDIDIDVQYQEIYTGGPRIARILGPKTIVLLGESC